MKKKIAIVVQRYGIEVNGGAEQHARRIAERIAPFYDVEVLTTTALKLESWDNYYHKGKTEINNVVVKRFLVEKPRNQLEMRKAIGKIEHPDRWENIGKANQDFVIAQGPYCPSLIEYIVNNKEIYQAFLFITYLYYPTVYGLPTVFDKAIFLPTAHDEPFLYYDIYRNIFTLPKDFLFNSEEEKELVHEVFHNENIRFKVVGEGVDTPDRLFPKRFKKIYELGEYILYVGRISSAKQCDWLIQAFSLYKERNPGSLKLVLIGRNENIKILHPDIIQTGFVTEQEKFDAMAGAQIFIMPSEYESLCMALLEAFSVGTPAIVNANCEVNRGHCLRGNSGLFYDNYLEFEAELNYLLANHAMRKRLGENGKKYVEENYAWDITIEHIAKIMEDYN